MLIDSQIETVLDITANAKMRDVFKHILITRTTCVDISNVVNWLASDTSRDEWNDEDLPTLLPPWRYTWFEFTVPPKYTWDAKTPWTKAGVNSFAMKIESDADRDHARDIFQKKDIHPDGKWLVLYYVFVKIWDRFNHLGNVAYLLDDMGKALDKHAWSPISKSSAERFTDSVLQLLVLAVFPVKVATTFLHCKNIVVRDEKSPAKLNKKRIKQGKFPLLQFKTLVIEPVQTILRHEGQMAKVGIKKALHKCRGHWKDYRQRGLFGQYHGIYWWDERVKGDETAGIIQKTYLVNRPEKVPQN